MQRRAVAGQPDLAVEQAPALEGMRRDVLVLVHDDGEPGQHRVAVVTVPVDRVLAVRDLVPHRAGDEFVLRLDRPVDVPRRVPLVAADDFLQEEDVRIEADQSVAQLVNHHPPVELRESLVDVVGGDGEAHGAFAAAVGTDDTGFRRRPSR